MNRIAKDDANDGKNEQTNLKYTTEITNKGIMSISDE